MKRFPNIINAIQLITFETNTNEEKQLNYDIIIKRSSLNFADIKRI